MPADPARRASTLLGLVTIALVLGAIAYFVLDDSEETSVSVERGNPLPRLGALDRSDAQGADTVRTYLQGAVNCDQDGRDLMELLSRPDETRVRDDLRALCVAEEATAEVRGDGTWAVRAEGLPAGYAVRLTKSRNGDWQIESPARVSPSGRTPAREPRPLGERSS